MRFGRGSSALVTVGNTVANSNIANSTQIDGARQKPLALLMVILSLPLGASAGSKSGANCHST